MIRQAILAFGGCLAALLGFSAQAAPTHALTVYGEAARYPAGFSHFQYTNPDAPKGGSLRRSATVSYTHLRAHET